LVLIGSPLGAIIKKGGFGLPVLISIVFYILMYVLNIQGEKYVKEGQMSVMLGAWLSNMVLLLFGVYFTDRARNDSRLFDKDIYVMMFQQIKFRWKNFRNPLSKALEEEELQNRIPWRLKGLWRLYTHKVIRLRCIFSKNILFLRSFIFKKICRYNYVFNHGQEKRNLCIQRFS